ncbi:hypothetical protein HanXRQr2_Chr16g0754541 [Helianthus annuus]|uniref:Uncharacterized protein n=1 Tax=Helianthus annuus TaxID=4232 RepID=A0A9K3GYA5_HELAN|nr:hypothetical protein HanXRQr2_Chr16g0754541 [Helianthus annuus]KAJ0821690.1 hypothetical protein HanPSC8_Chr16g0723201 [Helianthus annuus]
MIGVHHNNNKTFRDRDPNPVSLRDRDPKPVSLRSPASGAKPVNHDGSSDGVMA